MTGRRGLRRSLRRGVSQLATTTSISPTTATQWDAATALTVNGTNFTPASVIYIDGVAQSTTYVGPTQVTCTIAAAETAGSPLQTSGTKSVRVDGSNAQTLTVSAWDFTTPGTPTLILDAANVTLNGGNVSSWNDTSGAGRHFTQGTAANQPLYIATHTWNSKPAIQFDGTNDVLNSAALFSAFASASAYTMLVVFNATAIDTNNANVYLNDGILADANGYGGIFLKSAPTINSFNYDTNTDTSSLSIATATNYVYSQRHGGGNLDHRLGLNAVTSVASGNTGNLNGVLRLGANYVPSQYFSGVMGHVLIWNTALSDADMDRAVRKLKVHYAI